MSASITIKAFKKSKYKEEVGTWQGAYQPEKMTLSYKNSFTNNLANGISRSPSYAGPEPSRLNFPIIFDNTDFDIADPNKKAPLITKQLEVFKKLIFTMNGDSHQGNFLMVISGKLVFKGQCESLNVKYTSFDQQGEPRRAFADLTILRSEDLDILKAEIKMSSPDVSHFLTLVAGKTLSNIAYQYYENPRYCFELAKANRLASPRKVRVGTPIEIPPLR